MYVPPLRVVKMVASLVYTSLCLIAAFRFGGKRRFK